MTAIKKATLYYVYDPMCSWCWGYRPTWEKVKQGVNGHVDITYVLGGLAPDSDVAMPIDMQKQIASYWKKIEEYLGTEFNYDFWTKNTPRRSTYPACRALLAARAQGAEETMLAAIQKAYYLDAQNPSDNETLIQLAGELNLDLDAFKKRLVSQETQNTLLREIQFARSIGGNSFPSLFIEKKGSVTELKIDYQDEAATVKAILSD
ncbi:DsbA family protein [Vibrio genomosp. F10]|uniref:DsbA family protein n=1 Tax=Vibrio genomosp. F10 TaxID=723171 RepID=UPI0002ECB112|nr:DsbA family protein [Vibrio genomosp. F10]OEF06267.1 thioredoxin [Vibrio genomosp. F10 str. 9ZD137]